LPPDGSSPPAGWLPEFCRSSSIEKKSIPLILIKHTLYDEDIVRPLNREKRQKRLQAAALLRNLGVPGAIACYL